MGKCLQCTLLKLINDEMMTIGRPRRSFCPTAYLYARKCPTRLAFRQRTRIGCSPSRRCRNYCHRFGQRPSYGRSAFLWRPGILGWAYPANLVWNHRADDFGSLTQVTWFTNPEQDLNPFHIRNWRRRSWQKLSHSPSAQKRRKLQQIWHRRSTTRWMLFAVGALPWKFKKFL